MPPHPLGWPGEAVAEESKEARTEIDGARVQAHSCRLCHLVPSAIQSVSHTASSSPPTYFLLFCKISSLVATATAAATTTNIITIINTVIVVTSGGSSRVSSTFVVNLVV